MFSLPFIIVGNIFIIFGALGIVGIVMRAISQEGGQKDNE